MSDTDRDALAHWWRAFIRDGELPSTLQRVQGRLIRSVHRGRLGRGDVYVKTMTFPRAKDRLRYLIREMPAAHEAAMLRATAASGVACPEVVAAYTERRYGLPRRSMLVLRALDVVVEDRPPERRTADEIHLAMRLLRRGIYHGDLHGDNFVRLSSGDLAVLDMQSAQLFDPNAKEMKSRRQAVAARILRELSGAKERAAIDAMLGCQMIDSDDEVAGVLEARDRGRWRYQRARIRRCLQSSTEFERRLSWSGVCYRSRAKQSGGRWIRGGNELREAWLGQRIRQLQDDGPQMFGAFSRKWWWLGGGAALYVLDDCSDAEIQAAVTAAAGPARDLMSGRSMRWQRSG